MAVNYGKHFSESEFRCKCCGKLVVSQALLDNLNKVREELGAPIVITSAYRCVKHNKEVGGKSNSAHLRGFAVDIKCTDDVTRMKLIKILPKYFDRIGVKKSFIHCDVDKTLPQEVCFMY